MYCHDHAEGCGADAFFDSPTDCHAWCETKELGWHGDEGDPAMCPDAGPASPACGADSSAA